jgi:exodeoxyribonuclease V alpha subunit
VVKENPYILTEEISGIGFKTADKIARNLGVEINSPFRIQSGISYVINDFCMLGNTYMPLEKLIKQAEDVLSVNKDDIEQNIFQCVLDQKLKIESIDDVKCVFTLPYYYCEVGVTRKLLTLAFSDYKDIDIDGDQEILNFETESGIKFADSQKDAIKGTITNGIEVITGGPGTGKTTIIKCITQMFEAAGLKVLMAAPTGRAAKRMTEATGREAKTIHRLLEIGFSEDDEMSFVRDDDSQLECDVLIVDEASMIDIMLMNNLMKTLGLGTRLILVGDVDQLPSVGPGNVLRDIIESDGIKVVRLKDIFRQAEKSMIVVNAHKINNGEMPLLNAKDKDFYFIKEEDQNKVLDTIIELVNSRLPKFNKGWDKIKHIQVLSPMRKGILGVSNLNKNLQKIINPGSKVKKEKEYRDYLFREGDKVMQTKNNYSLKWERISGEGEGEGLGVFNGDIGYITEIDEEENLIYVVFDEERKIAYENLYLDELELAYATTIHKSQGSEFPVVIVPAFMGPPLLMNRNLLYTGITRAKQMVVLVGSIKAVNFMVNNNRSFERYSSLKWRITDVLKDDEFEHKASSNK